MLLQETKLLVEELVAALHNNFLKITSVTMAVISVIDIQKNIKKTRLLYFFIFNNICLNGGNLFSSFYKSKNESFLNFRNNKLRSILNRNFLEFQC